MQIVRNVQFQIKQGKHDEFTRMFNTEVIPALKKHEGFNEELALVSGDRALGISIWKDRSSAEKYQTAGYPKMLERLAPVIEGTPRVDTYELAATTLSL